MFMNKKVQCVASLWIFACIDYSKIFHLASPYDKIRTGGGADVNFHSLCAKAVQMAAGRAAP